MAHPILFIALLMGFAFGEDASRSAIGSMVDPGGNSPPIAHIGSAVDPGG